MTTKRRALKRNQRRRISQEALDAYQAGDHRRLHRALGLKPWDASPLDVTSRCRCPYPAENLIAQSWEEVRKLRQQIEALLGGSPHES